MCSHEGALDPGVVVRHAHEAFVTNVPTILLFSADQRLLLAVSSLALAWLLAGVCRSCTQRVNSPFPALDAVLAEMDSVFTRVAEGAAPAYHPAVLGRGGAAEDSTLVAEALLHDGSHEGKHGGELGGGAEALLGVQVEIGGSLQGGYRGLKHPAKPGTTSMSETGLASRYLTSPHSVKID